jgi:hypothetical protein
MKTDKAIRVGFISKVFILLIQFVDLIQGSILKNYAVFSFIVRYAPQKLGADACYYRAFKEFLIACQRVPAYRDFLRKRGWSCVSSDPKKILRSLPLTNKSDYILAYSTEERCLDGSFFSKGVVIDESSGAMGANIYPEDVESIIYSVPLLASSINGFTISLEEDAGGNPRPCFEFELLDSRPKLEVEAMLHQILSPELAKLSLDYKKAREEYPQAVEPIVRTFGMYEGPFKGNLSRIKRRYVKNS